MKAFSRLALAAFAVAGAAAIGNAEPAKASVGLSIGIYGGGDYDYYRPCSWYRYHDFPAPHRCYRYFQGIYGPTIFVDGDFIFRDRDDFGRWHDRDEYRHWRNHEFRREDWDHHDNGLHRGWENGHGHGHGHGHDDD